MTGFDQQFPMTSFLNGYQLVDGVAMHRDNPVHFQIPPDVIKRNLRPGQYVELRIDSPRFSVHKDAAETCECPSCSGVMTKPILRHQHPVSLFPVPKQDVPSRGWGEDFWVRIADRRNESFEGIVDNLLVESRLHGLKHGDRITFHQNQILAVHDVHRHELVAEMNVADLKELAQWVAQIRRRE